MTDAADLGAAASVWGCGWVELALTPWGRELGGLTPCHRLPSPTSAASLGGGETCGVTRRCGSATSISATPPGWSHQLLPVGESSETRCRGEQLQVAVTDEPAHLCRSRAAGEEPCCLAGAGCGRTSSRPGLAVGRCVGARRFRGQGTRAQSSSISTAFVINHGRRTVLPPPLPRIPDPTLRQLDQPRLRHCRARSSASSTSRPEAGVVAWTSRCSRIRRIQRKTGRPSALHEAWPNPLAGRPPPGRFSSC
jgi:hypothetical protein